MILDTNTWYLVSFLIFIGLVAKPLKSILSKAFSLKANEINKNLREAKRLKEEASEILAAAERKKTNAEMTAHEIMEHAKAELVKAQVRMEDEMKALVIKQEAILKQRMIDLQTKAKDDIYTQIVDTSLQTAQSIIEQKLTPDKQGHYTIHELKRLKHMKA